MKIERIIRRKAIALAALALGCAAFAGAPSAQAQPAAGLPSQIKILVGFAPGGGTDVLARVYADLLRTATGATVTVENKPGAGGQIAAQMLKAAPPDGSTLMFAVDHPVVMLRHVMKDPGFDVDKDFAPIARVATYSLCMAVGGGSAAKDLPGFMSGVKSSPAQGNFGVPAPGSNAHFMGFVLSRHFGAAMNPVAYRGAAPALQDLLGGQLPSAIMPCDMFPEQLKAGKVKILAIAADKRAQWMPDVPTLPELGVKVPSDYFTGVWTVAGTPKPVLDKLREVSRQMLSTPAAAERVAATGMVPAYGNAEELERITRESAAFWGEQIRQSGFQPN